MIDVTEHREMLLAAAAGTAAVAGSYLVTGWTRRSSSGPSTRPS
ncbi:hypothetical protein [Halorubrum saccharovorum]